jgi:hypothetical protein
MPDSNTCAIARGLPESCLTCGRAVERPCREVSSVSRGDGSGNALRLGAHLVERNSLHSSVTFQHIISSQRQATLFPTCPLRII